MEEHIDLTLQFLEPYRVVDWFEEKDRNNPRFLRGFSFARWHKNGNAKTGSPYITGTLIRSAIMKALEELLWLHDGEYEGISCCHGHVGGGKAVVVKGLPAKRLRRRQTLIWPDNSGCTPENPCPLCLFLGRHAETMGKANFRNLDIPGEKRSYDIDEIAEQRIINRVDQGTGKAEDFFPIREIDHALCGIFKGRIDLSGKVAEHKREISTLLRGALALVDTISGGLCCVTMSDDSPHPESGEGNVPLSEKIEVMKEKQDSLVAWEGVREEFAAAIQECARTVGEAFVDHNKQAHLRLCADVVRDLRRQDPDNLQFPAGHTDRLGEVTDHFLWDMEIENNCPLRQWLPLTYSKFRESYRIGWGLFCEELGRGLFLQSKERAPDQFPSPRPVGAMPGIGRAQESEFLPGSSNRGPGYEWLIQGMMVAETPFFFGWSNEKDDEDHVSMRLLATRDGYLRLPRSVLRGILRRDLQTVLGGGCRAELGRRTPCRCDVCKLLGNITIKDSRSDFKRPPRIRHRIRINPPNGTVAKGALFDIEIGPAGVPFPFELRLRTTEKVFPGALKNVLSWWREGNAFISGAKSTGKGHFRLGHLKYRVWDIKEEFADYLSNYGGRKDACVCCEDVSSTFLEMANPKSYPWSVWKDLSLKLSSPFLTKDPLASIADMGGSDAVCYQADYPDGKGGYTPRYIFKSESLRGILRTVVGRREDLLTKDHEDCDCLLCSLFGNEHEEGKVMVGDLLVQDNPLTKVLDRVAIDRFTGGALDRHKFDLTPLIGTPAHSLGLNGQIWTKTLDAGEEKALTQAIQDIDDGLYPLGGFTTVGFGRVKTPDSPHTNHKPQLRLLDNIAATGAVPGKTYWPKYFLPFSNKEVKRTTNEVPGHAHFDPGLYTGKLLCSLTTRTPLIIPDTDPASLDENGHQYYNFFNLLGDSCIPGSEIKGMISSVYEALTNSCMRVFQEKRKLSRRMEAKSLSGWIPGRISNNGREIKTFRGHARIPFYDNSQNHFKDFDNDQIEGREPVTLYVKKFKWKISLANPLTADRGKRDPKRWKSCRKATAEVIDTKEGSIRVLVERDGKKRRIWHRPDDLDKKILHDARKEGKTVIACWVRDSRFQMAMFKKPSDHPDGWEEENGYLHVVGPSKVDFRNDEPFDDMKAFIMDRKKRGESLPLVEPSLHWKDIRTNDYKKRYKKTEPVYYCYDGKTYYAMTKYCEAFFYDLKEEESYTISSEAFDLYRQLWVEYNHNPQAVPARIFQSAIVREKNRNKTLKDGDLVYFRKKNGQAVEIIPVRISRAVDDDVLGGRLPDDRRPCVREILDSDLEKKVKSAGLREMFQHHPEGLCPACALFGTPFYKGRVSFGFAFPENKGPKFLESGAYITLPRLERPRPTWPMPGKGSPVPGRTFYVHHQGWKAVVKDSQKGNSGKDANNRSAQAVDSNERFWFEITYENLRDWELGLLIYSLQLEPGLAHKLGMAKSRGFGSVKIQVEDISHYMKDDKVCLGKEFVEGEIEVAAQNKLHNIWKPDSEKALSDYLEDLCKALFYESRDEINVQYPGLEADKNDPERKPGYVELADDQYGPAERQKKLCNIWNEWWNSSAR